MMGDMADVEKKHFVDPGWPQNLPEGKHAVTELIAEDAGALSPYGDAEFPIPAEELNYVHPYTVINR